MKQVVLLIVLGLLSISLGLGIYADAAGMQIRTLVHQGLTRTYHVYLPPGHSRSKAAPLVIALHGGGGNGENMDRSTGRQITREADRRSWVTVFPEGVNIGVRDFMHTGLIWRKNLPVPFPVPFPLSQYGGINRERTGSLTRTNWVPDPNEEGNRPERR